MDKLIERCAGLDVHKKTVAACVRVPGPDGERRQETRTFSTMTDGLLALRDWLCAHGVRVVGMESTGAYWKPVVRHEAPYNRVEVRDLRHLAVAAAG
jgi:transposase